MEAAIVAHEDDLPARLFFHQRPQGHEEQVPALGRLERVSQFARLLFRAAVNYLLLVLARGCNCRLPSESRPHPRERLMEVNFHLILVDQDGSAIFGQRPLFMVLSF